MLDGFYQVPTPESSWDDCGRYLYTIRKSGLNLPFQDVLIAALAARAGTPLWTLDGHFALMQPHVPGLTLFAPSLP